MAGGERGEEGKDSSSDWRGEEGDLALASFALERTKRGRGRVCVCVPHFLSLDALSSPPPAAAADVEMDLV